MSKKLTHKYLLERLLYDPNSGKFIRISSHYQKKVGNLRSDGYLQIKICGKLYMASRLAWFYVHEKWPENELDHRDGNKANNAIKNLRESTRSSNMLNIPKKGKSGLPKWVMKYKNKYRAAICVNKKTTHLGVFNTPEEAHQIAAEFAKTIHGEFFNPG